MKSESPFPYEDIVALPRPLSEKHAPMSRHDRAAQFSPFAALVGYGEAVSETARLTQERSEPDEQLKELLDEKLKLLRDRLGEEPEVDITYFKPDLRKYGGEYVSLRGRLRRIDSVERSLLFADGQRIGIDDILEIEFV